MCIELSACVQRLNSAVLELEGQGGLDGQQKYVKRSSGVRRSLQRVLPALFAPKPGLPVTTKQATVHLFISPTL